MFRFFKQGLKETQQKIQAKLETTQKFQDSLTRFKKEVEDQDAIRFLTRDIARPALKQMEYAIRAGMVYAVLVKVFLIWDGITVAKLIESRKDIQKLMEQQQKMDKR